MNSELRKQGIDLIEKLSLTVIGTVKEVKTDLKDGKLSTGEMLGLIDNAISLVKQGLNWKALLAQVVDFDTDEGKQFAAFLVANGIEGEKAPVIIIHVAALAEKLFIAYEEDVKPIIEAIK